MSEHELKVWPEYFDAIQRGDKTFEIRKDDRGFREHDVLLLREYSPGPDEYTGREITARVTYCIRGNEAMGFAFGVRNGFVAMALAEATTVDHDSDFAVTIDRQKQIITICGINYAFDLFRGLGFKINPEAFFQIVERGDGVVTIRETRRTNADA